MRLREVLLCALLAGACELASAQDTTTGNAEMQAMQPAAAQQRGVGSYNSRDLTEILPQAGDLALGLDASPILDYFGNMFNNSIHNSTSSFLRSSSPILYMRYHLSDKLALRARLQWKGNKQSSSFQVADQEALAKDPMSEAKVQDRKVIRNNGWTFGTGVQYFRGYGRLRGFVGCDLDYKVGRDVERYYYGNKMTSDNKTPLTSNWSSGSSSNKSERLLVKSAGWVHNIGVGAFVGVEYYFLPKMCIGVESGARMNATLRGKGKEQSERFVGNTYHNDWVKTTDVNPDVDFTVATETPGDHFYANFYFMFHF